MVDRNGRNGIIEELSLLLCRPIRVLEISASLYCELSSDKCNEKRASKYQK